MMEKIRAAGVLLICISLSMLCGFKLKLMHDGYLQKQVRAKFLAETQREAKDSGVRDDGGQQYTAGVGSYTAVTGADVALIDIDSVGLSVNVIEGVEKKDLHIAVGHYPQSDMPWVPGGNFAVAGHSSIVYNCLFNDLHKVKTGMDVKVTTKYGVYWYTVTQIYVVEPTDTSCIERSDTGKNLITMTTCINSGKQRLIVQGEMKKASEAERDAMLKQQKRK